MPNVHMYKSMIGRVCTLDWCLLVNLTLSPMGDVIDWWGGVGMASSYRLNAAIALIPMLSGDLKIWIWWQKYGCGAATHTDTGAVASPKVGWSWYWWGYFWPCFPWLEPCLGFSILESPASILALSLVSAWGHVPTHLYLITLLHMWQQSCPGSA